MEVYALIIFFDRGVPKTGLLPTIRIRNVKTKSLEVNDDIMEEVGDGFYRYHFQTFDPNNLYAVRFDGTTILKASDRYGFGSNDCFVGDIRREYINKKDYERISDDHFVETLYDDDNTTPLRVTDINLVDGKETRVKQ